MTTKRVDESSPIVPDAAPNSVESAPRRRYFPALPPSVTHGFRALRLHNYRLYWISQVISLTGTWMQTTAQSWLVLKLTGSPFALGLVTTLQFLPVTILVLFGGVLADRLPKRRTIIVTQALALIHFPAHWDPKLRIPRGQVVAAASIVSPKY